MVDTTMTAHGSSSSSSSSNQWKYDTFLSFRGEDTRNGFTGHLHAALKEKGYEAFIDEDDLKRGEEIKEELFQAIEESRICIIVFSKRYADSSWCLDELVKIMECREKLGRKVLPIFYDVEASDIRKQEGSLAPIFWKHEEDILEEKDDKKREAKKERVKQWREALTQAASLSGQDLKNTDNGHEAKLIRRIIDENIWEWLPSTNELHVAKHPVGIHSRVQEIISDLSSGGSNEVIMVGIWGMGGLGKTTAAKAIYNHIHHMFESKSFLADVSDSTSKHGLVYLQETLVFDISKTKRQLGSVDQGISQLKKCFRHKRVLVIIDNVDKVGQINAIAGNHDWFSPGSRIIITTQDEHLLKQVDKTYSAQKLNKGEALELFSWHAFGNSWPDEGYLKLSKKVVSYCGGLPLALEVLGSFLYKRTIEEWKSQLEKLERTVDKEIIKPLRISFESLDDTQKAIFLDISCFFIGWDKDYVAKVLDACGFFATIGISVLRERCLVTVERNKLYMHDLLREMAKVIISEKSPGQPGKWSRLWNSREVTDVLKNKSGTEEVEGLALDFPNPWLPSSDNASFSTKAFANMKKLRLLKINSVKLTGEYKHLPIELIWLCWSGFPLQSIPNDFFNHEKLVVLEMQFSNLVQVWEGSKSFHKLKIINLSYSRYLKKSPDFSKLPNLEELILESCTRLSKIHPSIGHLERLSLVNLVGCRKLIYLPWDFYKSKSVETLLLNGCLKFRELHEDLGQMMSLRRLEASHTPIRQVPPSTVRLKNLTHLSLRDVRGIHLPYSLHGLNSLRELDLSFCKLRDDAIPKDLGSLISLQDLNLGGNDFRTIPSLNGLSKLEILRLNDCFNLHTLPSLSGLSKLKILQLNNCFNFRTLPSLGGLSKLEILRLNHCFNLHTIPSLSGLSTLKTMQLNNCFTFHTLSSLSGLLKLETLLLDKCSNLHTINDLPINLKFLYASGCLALETMPNFSEMSNMRELNVSDSSKLTEVPGLDMSLNSMTWIDMQRCKNLTYDFRKNILRGWTSCGFGGIFLYGDYVPDWFEFVNEGNKVSFYIPPSDGRNFEGLTMFCLYHSRSYKYKCGVPLAIIDVNNTKCTELGTCIGREDWDLQMHNRDYYLWQGQLSNDKLNLQGGDKVDIIFELPDRRDHQATMKRIGINRVWDKPMKENMHDLDGNGMFLTHIRRHNQGGDASSSSHI